MAAHSKVHDDTAAVEGPSAKALLVLGMHRSGTSAMTRLLSLAGARLPAKIMMPGPDNPVGYWEPWEAVALNDDLLASVDSAWDDIFAFAGGPRVWAASGQAVARATTFLDESFQDSPAPITLKDPRSSVLVQVWDAALRAKQFEPVYVIMVRNPLEIAGSLGARDRFPTEKSALLWLSYMLAAERDTRGAARIFVSYADLLDDWRGVMDRIDQVSGSALPARSDAQAAEIDRFLAPDLRHHAQDADALELDPRVWGGVKAAYRWFEKAARGSAPPSGELDTIAERLSELEAAVGPVLVDMRRRTDRAIAYRSLQDRSRDAQLEILRRELLVARGNTERARYALEEVSRRGTAEAAAHKALEAELEAEIERSQAAQQSLREEMSRALGAAEGLAAALQGDISALRASSSWRVTAPLRRFSELVGRARAPLAPRLKRRREEQAHAKAIAASGLFDAEWYRQANPDVAAAGLDPLRHFLRSGWREGRHPSPQFDIAYYRWAHPDVAEAGLNPLVHFVNHGRAERRSFKPVGAWSSESLSSARDSLPMAAYSAARLERLVVAVHAYYPDVFDEICERLSVLPAGYTLCVATPTEEARAAAMQSIARHALAPGELDVRVAQNRGRNFGPLLVEFGPVILQHDYVLHLHTKKSLYTEAEQRQWRDNLYGALLGERPHLEHIFGLLSAQREVGLIYPAPFGQMPYWANHWLQNSGLAPGLFARLGVSAYSAHGYIDYPVGGMFWAKVDAIRPLFECGLGYDDFPAEAGQTDGTLAHAIERCFAPLAASRGYRFAEVDPNLQIYRIGWSEKNLHQYAGRSLETLKAAIDAAQVVSFDIFDTLLTRPSLSPDAVQRYVGRLLALRHPGSPDFFTERKAAEHRCRAQRNWTGDVGLHEIYAAFGPAWSAGLAAEALALEEDLEARIALPRAPVIEALTYARSRGKRVVAVSDTYFGAQAISRLLERAGVEPRTFDAIYLSSELGVRKDRGDIWPRLLELEGAPRQAWLHVGDNEVSDVQKVSDLGIAHFHVMTPSVLLLEKRYIPEAALVDDAAALLLGPCAARLGADPFPAEGLLRPVQVKSAEDLGYVVFGPVVFAFVAWLAAQSRASKPRHLYFLSREGYLLQPAYERLRERLGAEDLPPSSYLHASRRAVIMARQAVTFEPDAVLAGGGGFLGDFAGLARGRLGLEVAGPDAATPLALPGDRDLARACLERTRSLILPQAQDELKALRAYLAAEGVDEASAVVDVGYSATIQKGLQKILGHGLQGVYMSVFADAGLGNEGSVSGFFLDEVNGRGSDLISSVSLILEAFLTAPHGQVDRFELTEDGAKPVFKPVTRASSELELLAAAHAGALAYMDDLLGFFGPEVALLTPDPDLALAPLSALARGLIQAPSEVLAALKVDDAFSGKAEHEVGAGLAAI